MNLGPKTTPPRQIRG